MKFPCRKSKVQEYGCMVCKKPWWKSVHKQVGFDKCLVDEILYLWDNKVITTGSCCGNHEGMKGEGFINVAEESIPIMKKLGYKQYIFKHDQKRNDTFIPKTDFNFSTSEYK